MYPELHYRIARDSWAYTSAQIPPSFHPLVEPETPSPRGVLQMSRSSFVTPSAYWTINTSWVAPSCHWTPPIHRLKSHHNTPPSYCSWLNRPVRMRQGTPCLYSTSQLASAMQRHFSPSHTQVHPRLRMELRCSPMDARTLFATDTCDAAHRIDVET